MIKIIGFDADDTLWINEPYYRDMEHKIGIMLSEYLPLEKVSEKLFEIEMKNLKLFGYGAKGFTLSILEAAVEISGGQLTGAQTTEILTLGKNLLTTPIEILPGVENVLQQIKDKYMLVVITKGDLVDQQNKLERSGLDHYFDHIEIVSDKQPVHYSRLIDQLQIKPEEFLMIGNSLKSDVLPVLEVGANAIHVPYHTTWQHEMQVENHDFEYLTLQAIDELLPVLEKK